MANYKCRCLYYEVSPGVAITTPLKTKICNNSIFAIMAYLANKSLVVNFGGFYIHTEERYQKGFVNINSTVNHVSFEYQRPFLRQVFDEKDFLVDPSDFVRPQTARDAFLDLIPKSRIPKLEISTLIKQHNLK